MMKTQNTPPKMDGAQIRYLAQQIANVAGGGEDPNIVEYLAEMIRDHGIPTALRAAADVLDPEA